MKTIAAACLAVTLLAEIGFAQGSEEEQVRRAMAENQAAILHKDAATLSREYGDDYMRIGNTGTIQSKAEAIKALVGSDWTVTHHEQSDIKIRLYGDAAVVTGLSTFTGAHKGQPPQTHKERYTQVWVKRNGRWEMTLQQRTSIEPVPASFYH